MRHFNQLIFSGIISVIVITAFVFSISSPVLAAPLDSKGLQLLEEIQDAISELAEHVTPTVVGVSAIRQLSSPGKIPRQGRFKVPGAGSGVVIHEDGYIVTNNHVINNSVEAEVHFSDQSTLVAQIVAQDPDTDLALLKVETDRKLPSATFGDSGTVKVGQWVLAVGNPFGLDRTVTLGVVSGIGRENMNLSRYENFIQTDASINPGNSGGPLFNLRGEVIGINTAIINFAQGIGFAIPSNMANRIIEQLKTGGKVVRGWLGVGIQPLTPQLAEKFGVPDGKGVLVNEVFAGDPADQAGVKSGDIITRIGNERLESPNQLSRVVAGFSPGDKVMVHVIRDGALLQLPVFLGIKQEKPIVASLPPTPAEVDLGIDVSPITEELAEQFSLDQRTGILVVQVVQGSVAYAEGLRKGDIIQEVNRASVSTMREFRRILKGVQPGETILLRILRESKAFFVVLKP
ncbi:MAG: Do family serine endopeptidase [Nitrospira sp. SB0662_bin_26]|nr:Do family serine endopeptidase [Nitrospira sp. SB0662_bin_26]